MVQINFLVFFAFKFCCKVLELAAADSVFSRASTASSSLSRIWKIPICSSCFSIQSESGPSEAFASSTESRGSITSAATIPELASHLEKINLHNKIATSHNVSLILFCDLCPFLTLFEMLYTFWARVLFCCGLTEVNKLCSFGFPWRPQQDGPYLRLPEQDGIAGGVNQEEVKLYLRVRVRDCLLSDQV
jgi:hypothetical protein